MRKTLIVSIFMLFIGGSVLGQSALDLEPQLNNPYQTIRNHLYYVNEDHYFPKVSAASFNLDKHDSADAIIWAIKLKQILDGSGIYIQLDELPRESDFVDSAANFNRNKYTLTDKFPSIYIEKNKNDGNWYYSETTIENINALHSEVYPFGTDVLLTFLPKLGNKKIWGLHLWQHIGILILIIIGFSIFKILNFVFTRLISQTLSRMGYKNIARNFILPIAKPFSMLVVFFLLMMLVPVLQLPAVISQYIIKGLRGIWPVFATLIFYHLVDILGVYLEQVADKTESTLDDQLVPLLRKSLKAFVIVVGGLFILQNLDFNITALLAGLSIGGLAFALAAQDTIKNFFGSLMIFVDKPFQIGHWITSGDIDGTVEEVGFRSTRVRTFRNSVTYVPNGKLADMVIDNHGLRQYRRFYTQISITYDTPAERIQLFVDGLRKIVENHPDTRKDYFNIYLNDLAAYSLNVMFYVFFAVPTWPEELRCRHEIILEVIQLAEKIGIRFAFPTQTLHMETFPEKSSLTPMYTEDIQQVKSRVEQYLNSPQNQKGAQST